MSNNIYSRIANARKAKGLTQQQLADKLGVTFQAVSSWETGKFVPDTWNLIELAKVCDVSVSSLVEDRGDYSFETTKEIYDWQRMKTYVLTTAKALKLKDSLKALDFALEAHKDQKRKKSDIPYIYHPLNLACHALAMDIKDDSIIAACLLHDVIEDCDVKVEDLPVCDECKNLVDQLTHEKLEDEEDSLKNYYKKVSSNPKVSLIKLIDRCNNLTTMSWGLSREKVYRYIKTTEEYILPLIKVVKKEVEYNNAAWLLSYQIKSMLDIYKRLM